MTDGADPSMGPAVRTARHAAGTARTLAKFTLPLPAGYPARLSYPETHPTAPRARDSGLSSTLGIIAKPVLGELHHRYFRAA